MLRLLLICCYAVYCSAESTCDIKCPFKNSSHLLEHYWMDFFGTVPRHAFPGGTDEEAIDTFIGQAFINNRALLPGTIFKGCDKLRTEANLQILTPNTHIKILCVKSERNLEWKPTKARELNLLVGCNLVIGGVEVGRTIYIGRANFLGRTIIGKVFPDDASNAGLWIPEKNSVITEFEVLTWGC